MAQNDEAVFTAARGYILTAPVGTAAPTPTDISDFASAKDLSIFADYETVGHTAREELPVFGFEGGETETKGTWQNASFKQVVTEVPSDYVTFNLHQFDDTALGFYYGVDGGTTQGVFAVQDAPTTTVDRALLIVILDGDNAVAFHASKAGIKREESIELAVDEFAYLPLRATFLKNDTDPLFSWISEATINPAPSP